MVTEIQNVRAAVIGLGTMGRGIARALLAAGGTVSAYDPTPLTAAYMRDHGLAELQMHPSAEESVSDAHIVFEAVFEDLEVKERVLRVVSEASADAVIASNTSTFRPSVLAPFVRRPERLLIAHFFNPPDVVPLVEVVPHAGTDPAAVDIVVGLMRRLGKRPVLLRTETTGFVANRLQAAMLRESLALIEAGVADAEAVDEVVMSALAPRWAIAGPIGVADLGGLDVFAALCAEIFPTLDNSEVPSDVLLDLVAAGRLGAKSGRGFYAHSSRSVRVAAQRMAWVFAMEKNGKDLPIDSAGI
ncbi:3-hydroxyacyl-CoA dehydrogenase family protein [Microbacterium sp. No. 7]|uniref:3-hydroxyacyl-CoA dehydrogenase family protein n=1 Tax=Microbacterium sp. No. 7 TaxID=1714373 RepID=UPI0006D13D76|nr:3-hydroxyacyl-CoA dehydrogenase family protein [Microbacterium sp. No. 7]